MSDDTFTTDHPQTVALLTRALAAVAASTPAPDRSAELLADLEDREPASGAPALLRDAAPGNVDGDGDEPVADDDVVVPFDPPHRRHRLLALVAAVVLLLAVTAVALTRLGDDADSGVVTSPGQVDTGWLLPPEGWQVTSVSTDFLDIEGYGDCPCTQWAAARSGDDPGSLTAVESGPLDESSGLDLMTETHGVDVGGRHGTVASWSVPGESEDSLVVVESSGRTLALQASGVAIDDVVLVADEWLDQVDAGVEVDTASLPRPEGFSGIAASRKGGAFEHMVMIRARQPSTGREVEYRVVPTGYERSFLGIADSIEVVDGRIIASRATDESAAGGADVRMRAVVDDRLDVVVGDSLTGPPLPPLSDDELDAFVDGLREVPTGEWRDAIADADVSNAKVVEAVSLFESPLTG